MKISAIITIGLLTVCGCVPKPVENTNDQEAQTNFVEPLNSLEGALEPKDLQGEWHMITEVDGEWILYYPCDADNIFIQLKSDSIIIGWGQDATAGKIENWSTDDNTLTLAVNDSYSVNTYQVNPGKEYTEWWLWEDAEKPSRFIPASQKSLYKEVKQPCKECWEDCEGDL
jgi:hypothetical protein